MEKIRAQFEGDYQLKFYLAPPLLAKRNGKGELIKQQYGPWMMKAFGLLAKMKGLRGTAFDIFGTTSERRGERALIGEYRATIESLLASLSKDRLDAAVAIAAIPEDIRGYGHVKERHLKAAHASQKKLISADQNQPSVQARAA